MKKILVLSYYFPPFGGGGVQRILKFLKYLDQNKYRITVLTTASPGLSLKDTKLEKEIPENLHVLRIGDKTPHDRFRKSRQPAKTVYETSAFKRWVSTQLFIPDSRRKWVSAIEEYMKNHPDRFAGFDLMVCSMPPYSAGLAAVKIHEKFDIPLILDYRDGWYYNHFQSWSTPVHKAINRYLETKVISRASGLIFVNRSLKEKYLTSFPGVDWSHKKLTVIYNGFDEADFSHLEIKTNPGREKIHIGLPGTIYFKVNRPLTLLNVLKMKRDSLVNKVQFHIFGKWTKAFEHKIVKMNLTPFFKFSSYLSHQKYLSALYQMDYNFLFLEKKTRYIECGIPGRFYELLRADIPTVVWGPDRHEIQDIIQQTGGKNLYFPNNEPLITDFLNSMKIGKEYKQTNAAALNRFSRKKQAESFQDFLELLLSDLQAV